LRKGGENLAGSVSGPAQHGTSMEARSAKFRIGQVVKHRIYPFRGVIFDVDPVFSNTEEWWMAIPEDMRPSKDQPFYHLFAENEETEYVAYVSEQNLVSDESGLPVRHPRAREFFRRDRKGRYMIDRAELN
jgi:heat shock protein HspQ